MNPRLGLAVAVLAGMLALNAAYATAVPELLEATVPEMPFGYREAPSPTAEAGATFVDVTAETGVEVTRYRWTGGDLPYPAVIGGGIAVGDVDHDGFQDLYFPPGGPGHSAKLYRNEGDWRFQDITEAAGLNLTGFGTGALFGDHDNDGDEDLVTLTDQGLTLHENDGNATFTDITAQAGLSLDGLCGPRACQPSSALFLDHDRDGDLDLYVVNNLDWRQPGLHTSGQDYASLIYFAGRQDSLLFENQGDGTYQEVTQQAGVPNTGKGLSATALDVDLDGWPEIATANDITENALYHNQGDGTFEETARALHANEVKSSMGIAAGDVTGDGRADLLLSNFRGHKLSLLVQGEEGRFIYATEARGLGASWRGTGWGVQLFDYDLDGWLDVMHGVGRAVPLDPHKYDLHNLVFPELVEDAEDQLYRNLGQGSFAEVTYTAGDLPGITNTRAVVAVDLDNDGDEDLVRVNQQGLPAEVLRNDRHNEHRSIQLDLVGTQSNRDGYGAQVVVELPDGPTLVRELVSASGYQTGTPHVLTVGLGPHDAAEVTIHWPSGTIQELGPLPAGAHVVTEAGGPGGDP
ncbi:MAG: CRTAC1 family protein [Candidatus Thermoplasmatota archaeon]|nr:CRTAC1 family protein [Candidatus Thermoplasmatota archaeon]